VTNGNRIIQVGPLKSVKPPPGTLIVAAAGRFLMPGLWDMHVHLTGPPILAGRDRAANGDFYFPQFVASGVTGLRVMGGE
jgi:imidazolonepropionase-like amidohydrolase